MNIHMSPNAVLPSEEDAAEALATLRAWAASVSQAEIDALDPAVAQLEPGVSDVAYPVLSREYPEGFRVELSLIHI